MVVRVPRLSTVSLSEVAMAGVQNGLGTAAFTRALPASARASA